MSKAKRHDCEGTPVPIAELMKDPRNRRLHPPRNLEAIKVSLEEFGQQIPIVVSGRKRVIKGNGTLQAAIDLDWETIKITRSALKGKRATAFAIADNRTGELAEWDRDGLVADLTMLAEVDLLEPTGFSDAELAAMAADWAVDGLDPDRIPGHDEDGKHGIVRIEDVDLSARDAVVEVVKEALAAAGHDYKVIGC